MLYIHRKYCLVATLLVFIPASRPTIAQGTDGRTDARAVEIELEGKDKKALLADQSVLVPGNPPLTRGMVSQFQEFIEWMFDAILTREQREVIRAQMVESWRQKKKDDISAIVEFGKAADQVAALKPEEREAARPMIEKEVVKALQQENDESSRWLLSIYNAAHKPIAPGPPPLTRQVSDAQCEMFVFMLAQAANQEIVPDEATKAAWATQLAAAYKTMTPEARKEMAQTPVKWATLRLAWARASEKERAEVRDIWVKSLPSLFPASTAQQVMLKALKEVESLLQQKGNLTAELRKRGRTVLTEAITALKEEGGQKNLEFAGQATALLDQFQEPAPQSAQKQPTHDELIASAERKLAARAKSRAATNAMFSTISSMSMQSHYTNMNTILRMGDSPLRYVNSYGGQH